MGLTQDEMMMLNCGLVAAIISTFPAENYPKLLEESAVIIRAMLDDLGRRPIEPANA